MAAAGDGLVSNFDVAPSAVVARRAEYDGFTANAFFAQEAQTLGVSTPRLPEDAGVVALSASAAMSLEGTVDGAVPASTDRGSAVEIRRSRNS